MTQPLFCATALQMTDCGLPHKQEIFTSMAAARIDGVMDDRPPSHRICGRSYAYWDRPTLGPRIILDIEG